MVDAGRLGRKTGHGWYRYDGERHRPKDPPAESDPPAFDEVRRAGDGVAWHALPGSRLVELTGRRDYEAEAPFRELGMAVEWLAHDAPGGVLGRIVCQLVNEAAFAIGEDVGSAADVDAGMELGLNHPRGPVAWGDLIGLDAVLATIDELWEERHEERYRAAPLLRRAVALGAGLEEAATPWPPQT
jgi:3-hydroxybutyryl-CoA dehydrogenase